MAVLRSAATCFFSFCLFASFVYILNDLLDRESRPGASHEAPAPHRFRPSLPFSRRSVGRSLSSRGAAVATALPQSSRLVIIAYVLTSTLLSRPGQSPLLVVDVVLLGSFHTVRVIAGGSATGISNFALDARLSACSCSSALPWRSAMLRSIATGPRSGAASKPEAPGPLWRYGTASGLMAILVLALYINSAEVRAAYSSPKILWLMCPVFLYWILQDLAPRRSR